MTEFKETSILLGEHVKVIKAKNRNYVGLEGTVLYEKTVSKGYYIIIQDAKTGVEKLIQNCIVQVFNTKICLNLDTLSKKELKGINYTGICY